MKLVLIFLLVLSGIPRAYALSEEKYETETITMTGTIDMGTMVLDGPSRTLKDLVKNYIDIPKGALDWKVLASTKETLVEGKDKEGYDYQYYKPDFSKEVKELEGKEVTIKGFMFPLGAADEQKLFLLGPFPVGCPFHYHVAPALIVEVHAEKAPVKFSYDPVLVKGKLALVINDVENNTFYRLTDAELVK